MDVIDLTTDKYSIVEYIRYNTTFGERIVDVTINKIEVSFNPNLVVINKGIGDGFMLNFNYEDYKIWLRSKKINKIRNLNIS